MSPRFERYKKAVIAAAEAAAEEKIAYALLHHNFDEHPPERYEITITHDQAAREVGLKQAATVLRWIRKGDLKALPKEPGRRKRRIPLQEWERFKKIKGLREVDSEG